MPRYIGRHPTEPERDSVDNLKDVDITTTSPSATDNLLVYDSATGVYKPGSAAASGGGGGNLSAPTDADNFDDGALLGSDSTLSLTKFYIKSSGTYQGTDPGGAIAVDITLDGTNHTGFKTSDDLTESVDKINEMMLNIKNNYFVRHAKFVPKDSAASTAAVTGQANIGDTIFFHIPKELFDSTDGNVTRCDVLDWGDGSTAETNVTMNAVSGGNGAKYVSHQYNDPVDTGNGYTVQIRLYNHNAIEGTIGSSICFKLTDLLTSYTAKPDPALEYQFTNRANVQTTYQSTTPVNIDEDDPAGANAGKTIEISFRVKDSLTTTPFSHFAMRFTSGSNVSYYPTSLTNTQWNYTDNDGSQISNSWEAVTTSTSTPYRHDFNHRLDFNGTAKKDEQYTVDIKTYSNTADPDDAVGVENGILVMRLFKDYTDELTYTLTGYKTGNSGNNNEDADNLTWRNGGGSNGIGTLTPASLYNYEGYIIESGNATLDSGANIDFVNTYGTKIQFNYSDNKNNYSATTKDFNNLSTSHVIILRKTNNSGGDETRAINAKIISGGHSLSPFDSNSGDTTFTIKDDPRADFTAVSNPAPELSTGSTTTKGYLFTTYKNTTLNNFDFTNTSVNTNAYKWDFDNDGTQDSTTESPTGETPYSSTGSYGVKLIATGTNSEVHHQASAADDDTEIKPNMLEILATPTTSLPQTLVGQSMTLDSQGNTPKLCSSADDNSAGEASLSAGNDVIRRTAATVSATKISNFISAFPGPGYNNMDCVVKGYVNGSSAGNEKTFTTTYSNYNAGTNNGTTGALVISEEADEVTNTIPKGLGRKFKATVQATVSPGVNSYKLGHVRGSAAETTSDKLNFVYDDTNTNPAVGGTWTVTQQNAGTPRKVDGISYVKGGGSTSVSIASMTVTPVSGQCYYGGNDPITIADYTGTALGTQQAKEFSDLSEGGSAVSTPIAKNINFTNLSFIATLNPASGGGTNGKLKVKSKNVTGEGNYSNYPGSTTIMWWQQNIPNQSEVSTVAGASAYTAGGVLGTYIRRISTFSSETSDNPSYTATDHFYKDDEWNDSTANSLNQALRVYNTSPKWEWNNVDYSTNMIPTGNTDRSNAATNQYLDFCAQVGGFAATNVGIKIEGSNLNNYDSKSYGHKEIWVAIPEVSEATGAAGNSYNGWLTIDKTINTDNGIRDNTVPYNDTNQQVNLNLGTMSGNNSTLRNILFRVKLTTGMTVTSFSLVAYAS